LREKLPAVCFVVLAASAMLCAQDFTLPDDAHQAADAITAQGLRAHVRFLGDDSLEGRAPATRGDELAGLYLSTALEALGYQPGAPGGKWLQSFDIVGVDSKAPAVWSFRAPKGNVDLRYWDDYIAASGVQTDKAAIENAEVVSVGYGIQAPEYGWDDFKGADLHGKVLLIMNNDPDWDPNLFEGETRLYYGRWTYKYEEAARLGVAGAIIIHTTPSAGYPWQVGSFRGILAEVTSQLLSVNSDIGLISMEGEHEWKPLLRKEYSESDPQISPNGRWIAYTSGESDPPAVCVRPYPDVNKNKWTVSVDGGIRPFWSLDGRELYYFNAGEFLAVSFEADPVVEFWKPELLFRFSGMMPYTTPDLNPDGNRLLAIELAPPTDVPLSDMESASRSLHKINIVLNWFEELKKRVPVN
jgi:hypothetical protein